MKKRIIAMLLLGVIMMSCGSKNEATDSVTEETVFEETDVTEDVIAEETEIVDESENDEVSSSSSTDWDSILDEYEEYVNSYIRLYKKAMNGDMNAMTEYVKFMEKAESLFNKMDNADDMTMAQINRMNKIHAKMANAIQ